MIKAIHMKDCATYTNDICSFTDLQKVNFIYGANGSGKSTVSNYLKNQNDTKYSQCSVEWYGNPIQIEVYNKQFRQEHFQDNIDGVFTLGKATKEQIEEVEMLKEKRKEVEEKINVLEQDLKKTTEEKNQAELDFKDSLWIAILKKNEKDFGGAFSGFKGSKQAFYDEYVRRVKSQLSYEGTYDNLLERAATLLSKKPERIDELLIDIESSKNNVETIVNDILWDTVIIGNDDVQIADLIKRLNNNDWVRKGKEYILDSPVCPFCQKETIDASFKKQLEEYFDTTYETRIKQINTHKDDYQKEIERIIESLNLILDNPCIQRIDFPEEKYKLLIKNIKDIINLNIEKIAIKISEPSRKVKLDSIEDSINSVLDIINLANDRIIAHNKMVEDFDREKESLVNDVWSYCILDQKVLLESFDKEQTARLKAVEGLNKTINESKKYRDSITTEIIEKEKNITSVQPAVDEINRLLKAYGFEGFIIVPSPVKENAYQIQRQNGELATYTLSEGEETFISFLYFMQYVKGSPDLAKVSSRKVIVLDDPICSLDSTILYVVSAMVKELAESVKLGTSDVEQLIIFTHNVFFHKEASFVNGRIKEEKAVNYWIISKDNNVSNVRAYGRRNPISTSYELLWRELKENTNSSLITTQNIMRRIIENYFGMLGKKKDDTIIDSFKTTEERIICKALLYWINDGSHTIADDLYIDSYSDSLEKYKTVFRQIFENTNNIAHYNMMMQIDDTEG